jgi:hypothetical protein
VEQCDQRYQDWTVSLVTGLPAQKDADRCVRAVDAACSNEGGGVISDVEVIVRSVFNLDTTRMMVTYVIV